MHADIATSGSRCANRRMGAGGSRGDMRRSQNGGRRRQATVTRPRQMHAKVTAFCNRLPAVYSSESILVNFFSSRLVNFFSSRLVNFFVRAPVAAYAGGPRSCTSLRRRLSRTLLCVCVCLSV
eukprot:952385-Rhodomonas_salina.1